MASIAEYFLLQGASATAARIPDTGRKEIADALLVGRQKAEAAEALWSNGHAAEGLRLAVEALISTLDAAPKYGRALGSARSAVPAPVVKAAEAKIVESAAVVPKADGENGIEPISDAEATEAAAEAEALAPEAVAPEPVAPAVMVPEIAPEASEPEPAATEKSWREVLAERGVAKDKLAAIGEAEAKARTTVMPKLDADVSPSHSDVYQQLVRARAEVDRALAYAAMSPRELGWARIARISTASILGLMVIAALYFVLRTPTSITAEASDTFANSPTFQPQHIVDDNTSTEWLLPDRGTGWIEARLSPTRHVSSVTLLNSRNAPHFDRGTNEYRLEFYAGGRVVRTIDGAFATYERDPQPVSHEVGLDGVERVRFVVRSFHNVGAGLAEMTIEE